ncbi:MAG: hypothetical protein ABI847_14965, partial [Anaerolineales bacterium]
MKRRLVVLGVVLAAILPAMNWWSQSQQPVAAQPAPLTEAVQAAMAPALTQVPTRLPAASPVAMLISAPAATLAPSPVAVAQVLEPAAEVVPPFFEPAGCQAPPDDYSRVMVNGWWLSRRTLAMLKHAAELYGGPIDIAGTAITQGSYSHAGWGKFNTGSHLGGGALDLSVTQEHALRPLYHELEPLMKALRVAGFAAWLRDRSELFM